VNDRRDSVWVRPTSRGYPVVGEHLGSFASFLGRPFREYDFFAGVYDGMYFLAGEEFCPESMAADDRRRCLRARMEEFLSGKHVVVSPASRAVMEALFQEDFGRPPAIAAASAAGTDVERARLLRWLATANASLFGHAPRCHGGGVVDQFFCRSGFDRMLSYFDRDSVRATLRSLRQRCDSLGIARDECSADDAVVALLDHRERYLNRLTDRLMRQAWEVERYQERRVASSDSASGSRHEAVKAAHFLYRSTTEHHRRGIELDPSTIPDAESWNPWGVFALLPYYMAGGLGNSSTEGGWRPTWYMGRRFALVAPIDVAAFDAPGDRHELFASVGLGIHVRRQSFGLSAMHLSISSVVASEDAYPLGGIDRRLGTELVGYFLAGKFRLSIRHLAPAVRPALRGRRWMGSIGAADVNGMLYWLVR
jgi:hypothetical protein